MYPCLIVFTVIACWSGWSFNLCGLPLRLCADAIGVGIDLDLAVVLTAFSKGVLEVVSCFFLRGLPLPLRMLMVGFEFVVASVCLAGPTLVVFVLHGLPLCLRTGFGIVSPTFLNLRGRPLRLRTGSALGCCTPA